MKGASRCRDSLRRQTTHLLHIGHLAYLPATMVHSSTYSSPIIEFAEARRSSTEKNESMFDETEGEDILKTVLDDDWLSYQVVIMHPQH